MPQAATQSSEPTGQFTMLCIRCERPVIARHAWLGREVHCPYCMSVIRVPQTAPPPGITVRSDGPDLRAKAQFNFGCPRCDCVLEAHTGMSGQTGRCPTCAARFIVPHLNAARFPERAQLVEGEKIDPQPVHAYAASGDQAPTIHRGKNDELLIECPRCNRLNPVDADQCSNCSAPFTMEAAPTTTKAAADSRSVTSLVFGIVGVVMFPTILPSVLAIFFGGMAVFTPLGAAVPMTGIIGLALGLIAFVGGILFWALR